MGLERDECFLEDLATCRRLFEQQLQRPMTIDAFPNGSYQPEQITLLRDHGVPHILLVEAIAAGRTVPRIPQHRVAAGRTFSSAAWNGHAMRRAWRTFRRDCTPERLQGRAFQELRASVTVFPLTAPAERPRTPAPLTAAETP
jgi:hypothetical protein